MRQKFVIPFYFILLSVLLAFLAAPVQPTAAQPEEESDFVVTLALMAVADDRMDGVMDVSTLSNLRAVVDDYYTQKGYLQMDAEAASALNHQKQVVLSSLDKKIQNKNTLTYRAQVGLFIGMVDSIDDAYKRAPDVNGDPYDVFYGALSSGYEPDPEAIAMLQQRLSASTQSTLQQNLDGHVAAGVPGGRSLINQSSARVYDFDAGQSSTGADLQTVQPRPIKFFNTGSKTVHVSVAYYQPPKGLAVSLPGMNLEVPGQSSILASGFPQGNYVFCVDWETDLDTNGDGQKDYDRASIRGWVSTSHAEDPQQAQVVQLSASFSETPTGRCGGFVGEAPGTEEAMREAAMTEDDPVYSQVQPTDVQPTEELPDDRYENDPQSDSDENDTQGDSGGGSSGADFWDQSGGNDNSFGSYSLTSAEEAHSGGHSYQVVCKEEGKRMEATEYVYTTIQFTQDGVNLSDLRGGQVSVFYPRVGANTYQRSDGSRITFTEYGFFTKLWMYTETTSEGVEKKVYRNCTALFNE